MALREIQTVPVRILPDGRFSRRDAAAYLGVSPKTLAMWAVNGRGPRPVKVGGRCFYFKLDLDAFIAGDDAPVSDCIEAQVVEEGAV